MTSGSSGSWPGQTTGDRCIGMSCSKGELCCKGLQCCGGNPIPKGEEYCDVTCPSSDRNLKENFQTIDPTDVLAKVVDMDISTWNYKAEDPSIRHMGPMAQDFKATFDLGASDRSIFVIDADGVSLAAIQGLHAELEQLRAENEDLKATVHTLVQRVRTLEQ